MDEDEIQAFVKILREEPLCAMSRLAVLAGPPAGIPRRPDVDDALDYARSKIATDGLPSPPKDLPRRGDSFRFWKDGSIYVVTGVSRDERFTSDFHVHYLPEGVSEDDQIPWHHTYDRFMECVIPEEQADWLKPVPVRRYEPLGRRAVKSFLRPKVAAFAKAMEEKLRKNDHKGGWEKDAPHDLIARIEDEMNELNVVVTRFVEERDRLERVTKLGHGQSQLDSIRRIMDKLSACSLEEAVDVANFALFVTDVCGGLDQKAETSGVR